MSTIIILPIFDVRIIVHKKLISWRQHTFNWLPIRITIKIQKKHHSKFLKINWLQIRWQHIPNLPADISVILENY